MMRLISIQYKFIAMLFFSFLVFGCSPRFTKNVTRSSTYSLIHGELIVDDPLAQELIASLPMQRLKGINQYGTSYFVLPIQKSYTRFEHSLGVYYILKRQGASRKEQIAGLLHDVSHTAFSHSVDSLFMGDLISGSFQDFIHVQFLREHGLETILKKYGFLAEEMDLLDGNFLALKQKHPCLCADRIEYIIYGGYMDGILTQSEAREINKALRFKNGNWYFTKQEAAKKVAQLSLQGTLEQWGGPEAIYLGHKSGELFALAMKEKVIEKEELLFSKSDVQLWKKIKESSNPKIISSLRQLYAYDEVIKALPQSCEKRFYSKFRGVDPLVKSDNKELINLTKLDEKFKVQFNNAREQVAQGWCLPLEHHVATAER